MTDFDFSAWAQGHIPGLIKSIILVIIGLPVLRLLSASLQRLFKNEVSAQSGMLAAKTIWYGGLTLIVIMVMRELGFKLVTLLGAAGVAGVAVGFASQTSLSNVISGLFLLAEKPFEAGDVLQVGSSVGTVTSIDMLSCKLRTFDNKFVRIPNEHLIKNEFTNITRYPIRRYDINIGVAYKEDIARVIGVLREVADKNPMCLDEPEPVIIFTGFGDSSLNLLFGVWFAKENFIQLRNTINHEVKQRFDEEGIEIPFPHRTLYAGSVTEPFPVKVVSSNQERS